MEEKMDPREAKERNLDPSEAEIKEIDRLAEEGKLKPEKGLVPLPKEWKDGIAVALGLGTAGTGLAGIGVAALNWYLEHRPAIIEDVSAAQKPPAPEIIISSKSTAPEDFERFRAQVEATTEETLETKETVSPLSYTIRPGDTLINIAGKFNLPWQALYGKNIELIGKNPDFIREGDTLIIPDKERDHELIEALEILFQDYPEVMEGLPARAKATVEYLNHGFRPYNSEESAVRDYQIFEAHREGRPLIPQAVLETLVVYEVKYELNPVVQKVLAEMASGVRVINLILKDKAPADFFKGDIVPSIPENLTRRFVFEGGYEALGGGSGHRWFPSLFGRYDLYDGSHPGDSEAVKKALVGNGLHELWHAWIPFESAQPWSEDESREELLAHMSMSAVTAAGQEAVGLKPDIEPRIIYIYSVLKRAGVEDPYGEIVKAAAAYNGEKLWNLYESVRGPDDLSMDKLLSSIDPDHEFSYYSPEELEVFRAEYFPYLGK